MVTCGSCDTTDQCFLVGHAAGTHFFLMAQTKFSGNDTLAVYPQIVFAFVQKDRLLLTRVFQLSGSSFNSLKRRVWATIAPGATAPFSK